MWLDVVKENSPRTFKSCLTLLLRRTSKTTKLGEILPQILKPFNKQIEFNYYTWHWKILITKILSFKNKNDGSHLAYRLKAGKENISISCHLLHMLINPRNQTNS